MSQFLKALFPFLCTLLISHGEQTLRGKVDLDPLITLPAAYKLTPESFTETFSGKQKKSYSFQWLNKEQSRAIFKRRPFSNVELELTLLQGKVPVDELIVDFHDGVFQGVTVSVYNRGDSGAGQLSRADFKSRTETLEAYLSETLDSPPRKRKASASRGILTSGKVWRSKRGIAVLEYNPEAEEEKVAFVRMRLAQRDAGGVYAASLEDRSISTMKKSDLKKKVEKEGSAVVIQDLPMVDQGAKGYCVVASVQRVLEHYGISCDMHQLAEMAGTDPDRGTSALVANEQIGKIDYQFKTRFTCLAIGNGASGLFELEQGRYRGDPVTQKKFEKEIISAVDKGIPLLWCLTVGRYVESPPLKNQLTGGHMRVITGYDLEERRLIFSDSWGAGHGKKTMDLDDAYRCTLGLYMLAPTVN